MKTVIRCIIPHSNPAFKEPQMSIGPDLGLKDACRALKLAYDKETADLFETHVFLEDEYGKVIRGILNNGLPFSKGDLVRSPSGGTYVAGPIKHTSYPAHDTIVCQIMLHPVL